MTRWLKGIVGPTVALWLYIFPYSVVSAAGSIRGEIPKLADLASSIAFPLVISAWVVADAHKHGRRLVYDYDSLVFFGWPLIVPAYLFQTRGWRAVITLLWFASLWIAYAFLTSLFSTLFVSLRR